MKVEMLVLEEGYRVFKSKGEERKEYVFSGRDCAADKTERCSNNLVIVPTTEQIDKWKGKLADNKAIVTVKEISVAFNGDVRIKGEIAPLAAK